MQAMIFAAGLGTRLKPLTDKLPKALIEIDGVPLLKRVIEKLKASGCDHIVINVHHFAPLIIDYLKTNDNFGVDIRVSDETAELLETGGGLKHAQQLFRPDEPILIHNVDILSNIDLRAFYTTDRMMLCPTCGVPHEQASAVLLVSQRVTQRYLLFNDQMRLVGWVNLATGEVKSPFTEVQQASIDTIQHNYQLFAFSGIHLFSPTLFPLMESFTNRFSIIDFYLKNCRQVAIKGCVAQNLQLLDVGKVETLDAAHKFVESLNDTGQITL